MEIFIISFLLSITFILLFNRAFLKNKITDSINNRSSHSVIATRTGGISIFTVVFLISIYYYLTPKDVYDFSILIPLAIMVLVGLYDDIYKVDFKLKFIFQIIAAKIIIDNGYSIENLHGFLGVYELGRILSQILTIFIIIAIINAFNFIDGLDGLAISVFTTFILSYEFFSKFYTSFSALSYVLIIAILPLYYFNFRKKNKVFLGDSGSLFLGGLVSIYVVDILSVNYIIKPVFDVHKLVFIISILSYPIIDLIRVFFLRIYKGSSPFIADKNHIHHFLVSKFKNHYSVVLIIILFTTLTTLMTQLIINFL